MCCNILGTTIDAIRSNSKPASLSFARALIVYHLHDNLGYSLNSISTYVGNANHSALSVLRAKIRNTIKTGLPYQDYVRIQNFFLTYNLKRNNNVEFALNALLNISEMYELLDEDIRKQLEGMVEVIYTPGYSDDVANADR